MQGHGFTLAGARRTALASGALWWAEARMLAVGDLHLGKSERLARRGGALLPPYETAETLSRLEAAVDALAPATVVCLGDSFDDPAAARALDDAARLRLARLTAGRDWVWVAGNHDPVDADLPGSFRAEWRQGPLTFRHIADRAAAGEVSAHFHPKCRLGGRQRPCFLIDADRVILPAFGAYTGGLACDHPDLSALMRPDALAVATGPQALAVPVAALARATAGAGRGWRR